MTPENNPNHDSKDTDTRRRKLIPKLVGAVRTRMGMESDADILSDDVLLWKGEQEMALKVRATTAEIEAQVDRFRQENAGTGKADMVTPLQGLENDRVFTLVHGDNDEPAGRLDGGWTVSSLSEESHVTLYKPFVDDEGGVSVRTQTLPTDVFESAQVMAAKASKASAEEQSRIVMVGTLMRKINRGERLGPDERHGL